MQLLLILAVLAQAADAAVTCNGLQRGGRELNALLGQSCARVVGIKAAALGASVVLPRKVQRPLLIGLIVGGGIGVTVTLSLRNE